MLTEADLPLFELDGESFVRHPDLPLLPPGLEGRRLYERGDWLQIQLVSGEIGWVRRDQVLVDEQ